MKGTQVTANSQPVAESDGLRLEIQVLQERLRQIAEIAKRRSTGDANGPELRWDFRLIRSIAEGR